jgi:FixJ family two-component response regulator
MTIISNVFVVDDDAAVRSSLRMMLKVAGYSVAAFSSADEFLVTCTPETTGCIILDINMPGMDGHQLQETLNQRGSGLQIIFLTGQGSIPQSVRAIKSGAIDFLTKPVDATVLLARVSEALEQCSRQFKSKNNSHAIESRLADLTEREKEVMQFVVKGQTSKEIAEHLGLSIRTVENHRANIMYKTGASNVIELARLATTFPSGSEV